MGFKEDTFDNIPEDILERREVAAVGPLQHLGHLADLCIPQLFIDAVEVLCLCLPEFDLHHRCGIEPLQKWLCGVFLQDIPDLVCPLDYN